LLDFSSWKFPLEWRGVIAAALADQDASVCAFNDRGHDD
jgi:hypothetical protein